MLHLGVERGAGRLAVIPGRLLGGQEAPGGSRKTRRNEGVSGESLCSFHGSQSFDSGGKFALYPRELMMPQFSSAGHLNSPPTPRVFPPGSLPVAVTSVRRPSLARFLGYWPTPDPPWMFYYCNTAPASRSERLQAADRFQVSGRCQGQFLERSCQARETKECVACSACSSPPGPGGRGGG